MNLSMHFECGKFQLDLRIPRVMGIVNVTPDSFSDGGKLSSTTLAVEHALKLVEECANILDIGGESTRPNATPVSLQQELDRVIPVIEALISQVNVPLSIDTYKPQVMQSAIAVGVSIINDVRALQEDGALEVMANSNVGVCLMHMQGIPQTMQINPQYSDVVAEVKAFLAVLEKMQADPEETVMVGDSLEVDINPAKAVGIKAVLIDREGKIDDNSIVKIASLKELKNYL